MTAEVWAVLLAVGVPFLLRLVDYLLPPGRRFRLLDRWTVEDDEGGGGDDAAS